MRRQRLGVVFLFVGGGSWLGRFLAWYCGQSSWCLALGSWYGGCGLGVFIFVLVWRVCSWWKLLRA